MSTPLNQSQPENVLTFSHSLAITDFSHQLSSSVAHPCLTSCTFQPSTTSNTKVPSFRLSLFPKGINANFSDYLSIGFGAISVLENDAKLIVRYRVSLINSKGERCNTKELLYIFSSSKRVSVFGRFIARSELFDPSNGLLTDDRLFIHCEGTVLGEPTNLADLKLIASTQPEFLEKMYRDLAHKYVRNETQEDRQVYEHFQPFIVSAGIEESLSYTRLKMYQLFDEFTFKDYFSEFGQSPWQLFRLFESPEFFASENPTLKFKLIQLGPHFSSRNTYNFDLMVRDGGASRRFDLSEPKVSLISYKMSLSIGSDKNSLGTCDDIQCLNVPSNYSRLHKTLRFQKPEKHVNYFPDRLYDREYSPWFGTFKIRSKITVLCDISALDLSPIQGFTQLELEQSRKHLLECTNSSLLKSVDDKRDVTLVVNGTEFKVHGIFLAQSPLLKALATQSNRISIPDLSIGAFGPFLQYLYTGKVQSLDKYNAKELLIVASRYKLKILEKMCSFVLNQLPIAQSNGNS